MKVYVDKNDVEILEDLFQATNSYECWDCNRDDNLEIVSLADYTKQVRKEVCELIWGGFVGLNNINGNYEYKKFEDDFRKFLDQIEKGESECQKN